MSDDNRYQPEQPQVPHDAPADAGAPLDHPAYTHHPASYVAPAQEPVAPTAAAGEPGVTAPLQGGPIRIPATDAASAADGPYTYPRAADSTAPYPAAAVVADEPDDYMAPAYVPAAVSATPAKGHSTGAVIAAGIVGGLIGAVLIGGGMWAVISAVGLPKSVTVTNGASAGTQVINPKSIIEPAVAVARKVLPSVVNVTIYQNSAFGGTQEAGNGSGVVYKPGGYIITNNHVVSGADKITVKVGVKEIPATVVGTDPKTDIAVIKIADDLPTITVGDSSTLSVGQTVIAVGSPFGLDKTVTMGIISALGRQEFGGDSQNQGQGASSAITAYTNLIQTDAAINPGNSGGALVNAEGQLVGINTLIAAPAAQQSAGVGFAIPEQTVIAVADQLIKNGKVDHPFMGISSASLTPDIAAQMGKNAPSGGAIVQDVVANSPAAKAGIQRGDIIVTVADQPVKDAESFVLAVRSQKVGATVPVEIWRNGQNQTVQVTVGTDQATQ